MNKRNIATVLIWIGFCMIGIIFLADSFNISEILSNEKSPGFGRNQILGILLGIIAVVIGWFMKREKNHN